MHLCCAFCLCDFRYDRHSSATFADLPLLVHCSCLPHHHQSGIVWFHIDDCWNRYVFSSDLGFHPALKTYHAGATSNAPIRVDGTQHATASMYPPALTNPTPVIYMPLVLHAHPATCAHAHLTCVCPLVSLDATGAFLFTVPSFSTHTCYVNISDGG